MHIDELKVDREQAALMYRKYQEHRAYQKPHDEQIAQIYKRISKGQQVIRALESIKSAGVDAEGLPKLAIARADQALCYLHVRKPLVCFSNDKNWWPNSRGSRSKNIQMAWPECPGPEWKWTMEATVPLIPVHLRPRRGIENYHVQWEAEWTKRYPVDPYLLRRFGEDAWLVVAAWDLTDVERAVMSQRLNG
jgi:hypothetical protein